MAGVVAFAALFVIGSGCRRVDDRYLHRWSRRFDIALDVETRPLVVGRLRQARVLRSIAIAIGITVAGLPAYLNLIARDRASSFANQAVGSSWILAAALGCLTAEFLSARNARGNSRAALHARRSENYVSSVWLRVILTAAAIAAAAASAATLSDVPRVAIAWAGAIGAALAGGLVLLGLRLITDRPALAPDGQMRSVDDALRADGAHRLVGAGVALAITGAALTVGCALEAFATWLPLLTVPVSYTALSIWWTLARDASWSVTRPRSVVR